MSRISAALPLCFVLDKFSFHTFFLFHCQGEDGQVGQRGVAGESVSGCVS